MDADTVVAGRFVVERRAASGGMGAVYQAHDRETGRPVALKVLHGQSDGNERRDAEARMVQEASVLAGLEHPRIVRYVAHGRTGDGRPFLAMDWVEGETLSACLRRGPIPRGAALRIATALADALGYAHQRGLVHRDVKPGNVILRDGSLDGATLVDFGIARDHAGAHMTRTGMLLGTPAFMAPEQARGGRDVGAPADVFALGCVLFRALTGRNAFDGSDAVAVLAKVLLEDAPSVRELVPDVDPRIDEVVARLLEKEPSKRPSNGAAAAELLRRLEDVDGSMIPAPVGSTPRLTLAERRLVSLLLVGSSVDPEATLVGDAAVPASVARAREIARTVGARCEVLASGAIVVGFTGLGGAREQAALAATSALRLRDELGQSVVLATGRAVQGAEGTHAGATVSRSSAGDVFERAVHLRRGADEGGRAPAVFLDDTTAGLLDVRFEIHQDSSGGLQLLALRPTAEGVRTVLGKETPFVGRERELSTLEAVFAECEGEGIARVVLVTGAPGIGKSRLRRELASRLAARAARYETLDAYGDALSAGTPLSLFGQLLRRAAGITSGDRDGSAMRKLRARVARAVVPAEVDRVTEFLAEGASLAEASAPPSSHLHAARGQPMLMSEQIERAFTDFLAAECASGPLMLLIEDLQWGDAATVRILDAALGALAEAPLMILAFARPEVEDVFPRLWEKHQVVPLPLGALPRRACERLARGVLGDDASADVLARVAQGSAGNPLHLEELLRAQAEGRGDAPPETVLAMLQTRLETLDAETRRVLRAASVFGETFWRGGVAALVDEGALALLDEHLETLAVREIVVRRPRARFAGEEELDFRHALVRDAAYAMLTEDDAKTGHGLAAAWLESAGEHDAALLAEHLLRSEDPSRAAPHLVRSARTALEICDFARAMDLAARAAALDASPAIGGACALVEAEVHRWEGRTAEICAAAERALSLLPRGSADWLSAMRERAYSESYLGRMDRLVAIAEELEGCVTEALARDAEAPFRGPEGRALALATLQAITSMVVMGLRQRSDALLERVDAHLQPLVADDLVVAGRYCHARANRAAHARELEEVLAWVERGVEVARRAGDFRTAALNGVNIGFALLSLGEFELAERQLEGGRIESARYGLANSESTAMQNRGFALHCLGRDDEARALMVDVLARVDASKSPRLVSLAYLTLTRIALRAGDTDAAAEHVRAALAAAAGIPQSAYGLAVAAAVHLARGETGAALEAAERADALLRSMLSTTHVGEALIALVRARALYAVGRRDEARTAVCEAADRERAVAARLSEARRPKFLAIEEHAALFALEREWEGVSSS